MEGEIGAGEYGLGGLGVKFAERDDGLGVGVKCAEGEDEVGVKRGEGKDGGGVNREDGEEGVSVMCAEGVGFKQACAEIEEKVGVERIERFCGGVERGKETDGARIDEAGVNDKFLKGSFGESIKRILLPFDRQPVHLPVNEPERSKEEKRRSDRTDDKKSRNYLITEAVHQGKQKAWSSHVEPPPMRICQACSCTPVDKPGALNDILAKHPFPISQGPLLLPLDDHVMKEKVSTKEVFENKFMFKHDETQECFEWIPTMTGIDAWNSNAPTFYLQEPIFSAHGPVSTKTMGVAYTCNKETCVVHCPCSVCNDNRETCKFLCREQVCKECNSQCLKHQIKLPRLFDSETEHFTLVTNKLDAYKYANAYAGIPQSCLQCTQDVLEHQSLHLVFHTRCRFCRNDLRPFEQKNIVTIEEYEDAEKILKRCENQTCSYCLVQCKDKVERLKHEATLHENNGKYKCENCEKMYSNKSALGYHIETKHRNEDEVEKFYCNYCPSVFTTNTNLNRHIESIHQNPCLFECENCGETFSWKDNLNRHKREKHYKLNANLDFVEDMDAFLQHKCEQCNKSFKRKYQLHRHVNTVHSSIEYKKKFECSQCESKFSRADALKRHVNQKHN